ncbi:hypothetical protein B0A48_06555 [Cryoendolithus antarcticus]|uniref:Methyltransferase type 11 domain-containing protein n=1 Tax=Cryoendolithus antarcticus TaxID=1507870 RepID=A0A1V8TBD3_9PEZI|nr:hypothetical protein B0A48_06555 [Cryoendolithus antarcticus]
MHHSDRGVEEDFEDSVFGISIPAIGATSKSTGISTTQASIPRFQSPPSARDYTPSVPPLSHSTTPSTRYTASPYSLAITPSSAASYSSGPNAFAAAAASPDRSVSETKDRPNVRRRVSASEYASRLGLPPVRESSTSSSNSTVKASQPTATGWTKDQTTITEVSKSQGKVNAAISKAGVPSRSATTVQRKPVGDSTSTHRTIVVPPELAHLNVETPARNDRQKPLPPLRPSRDNTPSLTNVNRPSAVVQSDLPKVYTTYHKRTPSQETPLSAASPSIRGRFGLSSRSSSRQTDRVDSAISSAPPAHRTREQTPTPKDGPRLLRKDSPAIGSTAGPSPSKSPRFGFFSRRAKDVAEKGTEKPKKEARKGPAAGTGHEGYGRLHFRGRSGSTTSSTTNRSPSSDSTASSQIRPVAPRKNSAASRNEAQLDEFLRQRLSPVILRGSGGSNDGRSASIASVHPVSSSSPSLNSLPTPQLRLLPSAMDDGRSSQTSEHVSVRSDALTTDSEDDAFVQQRDLAARRSFGKLYANGRIPTRMPAPINTNIPPRLESLDSYDAETSAWPQTDSTLPPRASIDAREGLLLYAQPAELERKPSRKWNFFQRVHASPRKGRVTIRNGSSTSESNARATNLDNVGNYAMLNTISPVGLDEVARIVQENEASADEGGRRDMPARKLVPYEHRHTSLLPSPSTLAPPAFAQKPGVPNMMVRLNSSESPELLRAKMAIPSQMAHVVDIPRSPQVNQQSQLPPRPASQILHTPEQTQGAFETPELRSASESPRQPRLSPIGRIPRVVSRRDRDRRMPDTSFSRPFVNTQPKPTVRPPGSLYNQIRELASPIDGGSQPVSSTSGKSDSVSASKQSYPSSEQPTTSTNRTSAEYYAGNEFMAFPPRKNSEQSYSSSSGYGSWLGPSRVLMIEEDDVWNEYDDLMDETLPLKTPISGGSSLGAPFQYADMLHETKSPAMPAPLSFGLPLSQEPKAALPLPPRQRGEQSALSVPQQVARLMQPSLSPLTADSLSHFAAAYGDRHSGLTAGQRESWKAPQQRLSMQLVRNSTSSSRYSRSSRHSRSASLPEANARHSQSSMLSGARFSRDAQLHDIAEHDSDEEGSMRNLRAAALMTSKWLSFGRVLFSPAHNEMRLSNEPRVLILDGLGSDWSHYVAMSYPDAKIYNLGPSPGSDDAFTAASGWKTQKNSRHINFANISSPFPFPKGFFTAVVLRFPASTTEQAYAACVFECKRVLRPGGHLEVAVLDLDLMNMGTRGRKAVRGLKTRLQARDTSISLRNMSDVLIRLIGRRGFENVQRCVVGVPAAGRIPRSQDLSSTSSNRSSQQTSWEPEKPATVDDSSFADLLQDSRATGLHQTRNNDDGIVARVSQVGRWWYSACYEKPLLKNDKSIWNEPGLLRECEKQGTSFKLLICCAQKPTQTRRRTVSV